MDEIRKIIKAAERQNWRVIRTTKRYIHFFTQRVSGRHAIPTRPRVNGP
jgi:hypothetical protein